MRNKPIYIQGWTLRAIYADADGNSFPAEFRYVGSSNPNPRERYKDGKLVDWYLERETLAQIVQWEGDRLVRRLRFHSFDIPRDWAQPMSETVFAADDAAFTYVEV